MAPIPATRRFVTISALRSRNAVLIMLSSWPYVRQPSSVRDHLLQSGPRDSYGYKVPGNRRQTVPGHRDHPATRRVPGKAGEEWLLRLRHTKLAADRPAD